MAVFDPDDIVLAERNPDEIPLAHLSRQELFSLVCRIGQIVLPHNETLKGELPDVTAERMLDRIRYVEHLAAREHDYESSDKIKS